MINSHYRAALLFLLLCVTFGSAQLRAADAKREMSKTQVAGAFMGFQVVQLPEAPAWAKIDQPPLFTFTWLTDVHLSPARTQFFAAALHQIDAELKPDLVVITGDNNYVAEPDDPENPQPRSLRRHRFFKKFLDEHLKTPYAIIPGDNWPENFEKVFGPCQYSFDFGGLHMVFASIDRADHRSEGLAVFGEPTWAWLRSDLEQNRDRPTIFLMHEPVLPPTFLDAGELRKLLDKYPNVLAGFHGHLHIDMQVDSPIRSYLTCPALRARPHSGLKHVKVYRHALIVRTLEYDPTSKRLEMVNKWQKVDVPLQLGGKLHKLEPGAPLMKDLDVVPAHEHLDDPKLAERRQELVALAMDFFRQQLPALLKQTARTTSPTPTD